VKAVGAVAQLGERRFCKPEVVGSIPISSTNFKRELSEEWFRRNHRSLIFQTPTFILPRGFAGEDEEGEVSRR
jgi:hypothetical protein